MVYDEGRDVIRDTRPEYPPEFDEDTDYAPRDEKCGDCGKKLEWCEVCQVYYHLDHEDKHCFLVGTHRGCDDL